MNGWDAVAAADDAVPEDEAPLQSTYTFWYYKRNSGSKAVRCCCYWKLLVIYDAQRVEVVLTLWLLLQESYEKSIKELGEFKSVRAARLTAALRWLIVYMRLTLSRGVYMQVQGFWRLYNHLMRPNDLSTMDYHLFKSGIKPMWEVRCNSTHRIRTASFRR